MLYSVKEISDKIRENGFRIGKDDADPDPGATSLRIYYKGPRKILFFKIPVNTKVGKLDFSLASNNIWKFHNGYYGEGIDKLITSLSETYHVKIEHHDKDELNERSGPHWPFGSLFDSEKLY